MHVVDIRRPRDPTDDPREKRTLFVRIQHIVAAPRQAVDEVDKQQHVVPDLHARRSGLDVLDEMRAARAVDPHRQIGRCPTRLVGEHVDLVAIAHELANPVVRADRRTSRAVEHLRNDHQHPHAHALQYFTRRESADEGER
jgi:hypothetical protein